MDLSLLLLLLLSRLRLLFLSLSFLVRPLLLLSIVAMPRQASLLWLCCRFLDGGRRVWFGSAWRTLAVVVHALVATCDLSQEQGTERSHLGLDLRLGMPLALEHLLKFEALNRHLSLPLWYRQTRDLGKARVGGASGNHCWS